VKNILQKISDKKIQKKLKHEEQCPEDSNKRKKDEIPCIRRSPPWTGKKTAVRAVRMGRWVRALVRCRPSEIGRTAACDSARRRDAPRPPATRAPRLAPATCRPARGS
jgi:hypothetical protein